ncbi:MAG: hypothetical protein Q7R97_04870 [Candidatus Daviesbacteria bacterium]|nr:hypothetical protein [Candidatus Daviesbacteria bacterium]
MVIETNRQFEVDAKSVELIDSGLVAKSVDGTKLFKWVDYGSSIIFAYARHLSDDKSAIEMLDNMCQARNGNMSALTQYRSLVESSLKHYQQLHPEYENCVLGVDVSIERREQIKYNHREIGIWKPISI